MGISQLGGGSRLITRPGAASGGVLIPNTTGSSGATPSSDQVYGSWWQMAASTPADYVITAVMARFASTGANTQHGPIFLDVGIGASGSEQLIDTVMIFGTEASQASATANTIGGVAVLPVGLRIPAGSRLAARAAIYVAGGNGGSVVAVFHAVPYTSLE